MPFARPTRAAVTRGPAHPSGRALAGARRAAWTLNAVAGVGWALSLFGALSGFEPPMLVPAVLALSPWVGVGIVARSRGLVRALPVDDPRPSVGFTLWGSAVGLLASAPTVATGGAFVPAAAVVGGLLAAPLIARDDHLRARWWRPGAALLPALLYGAGVLLAADAYLDPRPPEVHRVAVEDTRVSTKWPPCRVSLAPSGAIDRPLWLRLERAACDTVRPGDPVEVERGAGAFGWPWYRPRRPAAW